MKKVSIGFIGGCINSHKDIDKANFYYSVVSELLLQHHNKIDFDVALATYYSYDKCVITTKDFIVQNKLNHLFVFVRNFPLMPLVKLLIKYDNSHGGVSWAIHPRIFSRTLSWNNKLTDYQKINEFVYKPRRKFEPKDINLLSGIALGLHQWSLKYVRAEIQKIDDFCKEQGVKLYVITPQKNLGAWLMNRLYKNTADNVKQYCKEKEITCLDIYSLSDENIGTDKIHFNINGHRMIGTMVYNELLQNIVLNA